MPMDPQVEALRRQRRTDRRPPLYEMSLPEARLADLADIRAGAGTPEPVARVLDREIPGPGGPLTIRIYRPSGAGPFPVLAYFYGGGWTLGNLDTSDAICRALTNGVGCVTVSVGYRLAPEHRYPAAVHDCHAAVRWIAAHAAELEADAGRIAVGGDSAGGNLAAAVTLLARDDGGPSIAAQLLVYPNTDYRSDTASMRQNDDDAFFNRRSVDWYWAHYLADPADGNDPLVSPLRAQDLSGLPAALVITAEYDPLRDQGEQYADRLRDSGVPVELTRYPGMVHGFFAMGGVVDAGARAVRQAVDWLAGRLHGTPGHRGP